MFRQQTRASNASEEATLSEAVKCQDCQAPATIHTVLIAGENSHTEIHLCQECAAKRKITPPGPSAVDVSMFVQQILGAIGAMPGGVPGELARLECPDCQAKFMDFRKEGRLGCPYDYVMFREGLMPLLFRVHRSKKHNGKRPLRGLAPVEQPNAVRKLRRQLRLAIEQEDFIAAANLRDQIQQKDSEHEP